MRDSPFRLRVGGKDECDPTAIHVRLFGYFSEFYMIHHANILFVVKNVPVKRQLTGISNK